MVRANTSTFIVPPSTDQVDLVKRRSSPPDPDTLEQLNEGFFFRTPTVSTRSSMCFEDPVLQVESIVMSIFLTAILVYICIESGFSKAADKFFALLCHILFN